MTVKLDQITVSDLTVEVVRKKIKNLQIGVYPPHGRVRVAAPLSMKEDAIKLAVAGKLGWIKKHQVKFANQERPLPREYVTGETHYFQGKRYRLNVLHQARPAVACHFEQGSIDLRIPEGSDIGRRESVLYEWYRCRLKDLVPELLGKWEQIIGVQAAEWGVKRMKTRWGTCNIKARRIWLNLELARQPIHCLEYIIVHELVHLLERLHNDRFTALMDRFLPLWRQHRDELKRVALEHGELG